MAKGGKKRKVDTQANIVEDSPTIHSLDISKIHSNIPMKMSLGILKIIHMERNCCKRYLKNVPVQPRERH